MKKSYIINCKSLPKTSWFWLHRKLGVKRDGKHELGVKTYDQHNTTLKPTYQKVNNVVI